MSFFRKYDLRCPVCLTEYSFKAMANSGVKQCPSCKTVLQPLETRFDGYIKVNWQDLRTLTIYSIRWSKIFDMEKRGDQDALRALRNILANLRKYRPVGAEELNPPIDPVYESMQRTDVAKLGEISTGDNMPFDLKPNAEGKIVSPFFRKLL